MRRFAIVLVFLLGAVAGAASLSTASAGAEDSLRDIARALDGIRDELRTIRRDGVRIQK